MLRKRFAGFRFSDGDGLYIDLHGLKLVAETGRDVTVGDDGADLVRHGDEGQGTFVYFRGIEDGDHFPCARDHYLIGAGFLHAGSLDRKSVV